MAKIIATRLTKTGNLVVNGSFDEVTDSIVYDSTLKLYLNASKTASYSGSGTSWVDQSGNSNNATLISSPTFTTSGGGAITFNPSGTGQYANVPIAAIPSGGSQISVCCWINLGNPTTPPAASVFSCYDSSGNRIVNIHLPWSDSVVYWDAGNSGGTYNRINTSTLTTAQKTGWHHWGFTLNASTGNMAIYLDGVSIATGTGKTLTLGTVSTVTYPCAIASFTGTANWNGSVSSFEIYNVALTAAQVAQNYYATSSPYTKLKTTSTTVYAGLFDEVTNAGGSTQISHRQTGNLQISGSFDEVTGMLVTDGLIAYIDASKSFNGNGVTTGSSVPIFDLVANNNATLSGTVNWVNRGDGSYWNWPTASATNYISSTLAQNYLDFTIVFQPDFTLTSDASLVGLIGTSTDATNSDKSLRFLGANGTGPWTLRNPDNTDGWASTATTFYLNGVASTTDGAALASGWNILGGKRTNTTNGTFAAPFKYYLGTEGFTAVRDFRGNIAAVAFYNRQLTAAEQLNNYNYFAARYGLPTLGI